jgi:hypothetical protein
VGSRDAGEVIDVAFVVLFIVAAVMTCLGTPVVRWRSSRPPQELTGPGPLSAEAEDPWATLAAIHTTFLSEHVEAAITTRFLAGHLTADRRRLAMAGIAEQDAARRRLVVPRAPG